MPRNLENVRTRFETCITSAEQFLNRCRTARHSTASRAAFRQLELEWCAEHALLKITVASEAFLEQALGAYVIGERAPGGFRAARKRKLHVPHSHALQIFRGDRKFVGWNAPGLVIQRAEFWLRDGEPFTTALAPVSQVLGYVRLMRNAIAHESESATDEFLIRTRQLYGALPRSVSPGHQLLEPCPAALPGLAGADLFTGIALMYRSLATTVVP
jgi:hypothetical protein